MLEKLERQLKKFVEERDWDQFHSAKNLSTQLTVEAAELLEHFIWNDNLDQIDLEEVKHEIGDVFNCLVLLAMKCNVDLFECAFQKLDINIQKYPSHLAKGKAIKYHKLNKRS